MYARFNNIELYNKCIKNDKVYKILFILQKLMYTVRPCSLQMLLIYLFNSYVFDLITYIQI